MIAVVVDEEIKLIKEIIKNINEQWKSARVLIEYNGKDHAQFDATFLSSDIEKRKDIDIDYQTYKDLKALKRNNISDTKWNVIELNINPDLSYEIIYSWDQQLLEEN